MEFLKNISSNSFVDTKIDTVPPEYEMGSKTSVRGKQRKTMKGNVITAGAVHDTAGRRRWGNTAIAATAGIRL